MTNRFEHPSLLSLEDLVGLGKALSDENRVRILLALRQRELCVCQIVELLDLAPSTVSKHLSVLRQAGLLALRKQGRWAYYRRAEAVASSPRAALFAWIDRTFQPEDPILLDDHRLLEEILSCSPEELCARAQR